MYEVTEREDMNVFATVLKGMPVSSEAGNAYLKKLSELANTAYAVSRGGKTVGLGLTIHKEEPFAGNLTLLHTIWASDPGAINALVQHIISKTRGHVDVLADLSKASEFSILLQLGFTEFVYDDTPKPFATMSYAYPFK